jgi:hypothetical protein
MQIDFFSAPCKQSNSNCQTPDIICRETTTLPNFGICDDPPPAATPAYLKFHSPDDWIAHVINLNSKKITFKAIDNCVPVYRVSGELECRCDGMFYYDNNLAFVELKDRGSKGWLSKGRTQLKITIASFIENHDINKFDRVEAYVCNKQRPFAITNNNSEVQKFKDETAALLSGTNGLLLKAVRNISI